MPAGDRNDAGPETFVIRPQEPEGGDAMIAQLTYALLDLIEYLSKLTDQGWELRHLERITRLLDEAFSRWGIWEPIPMAKPQARRGRNGHGNAEASKANAEGNGAVRGNSGRLLSGSLPRRVRSHPNDLEREGGD
jgi:hypothetical protein